MTWQRLFTRVPAVTAGSASWVRSLCVQSAEKEDYDVVIVGAGMVGAALASSLRTSALTSSLRVALLDAKVPAEKSEAPLGDVPEMRVSTLTPATVSLLERCGAWTDLAPPSSAHVEHMQVWDYGSSGFLRWSARQVGQSNMGYVAENSLIQSSLIKTLRESVNTDCLFPVTVQSISFPSHSADNGLASVQLESGDQLRTRLVVGADGAASRVRTLAGIEVSGRNYNQRGLVATVQVSDPTTTAWQRFLPTGPFALLPVRNGYFNIVWSTTEDVAKAVESASEAAAVQAFNEALHGGAARQNVEDTSDLDAFHVPPQITKIAGGMPRSFPLKRQLAESFVGKRLALVGDAYRVVHPLAGQGVNLGFADVMQLQTALEEALHSGQDLGDPLMLQVHPLFAHPLLNLCIQTGYESKRRLENKVMMTALDAIRDMFGVQALPFQAMRGMGLDALNIAKPLKNEIMLYAMGLKKAPSAVSFLT